MVQLALPRGSRIKTGKTWNRPEGKGKWKEFRVYRWNPEDEEEPAFSGYWINLAECGPMVLDGLIKIKNEMNSTLTFRRSCREGISGSCAMNIDGTNTLACTQTTDNIRGDVKRQVHPLPPLAVIKDLVPDLTHAYAQYALIEPWLGTVTPTPERERLQSPGGSGQAGGAGDLPSSASAVSTSCPGYWWNGDRYFSQAVCVEPIARSWTVARTAQRASGSINWKTHSNSIAATRS